MEYAGYIEQYSDRIRYMHMAMLGQLPSGTLMAVWQASPIVLDDLQANPPFSRFSPLRWAFQRF